VGVSLLGHVRRRKEPIVHVSTTKEREGKKESRRRTNACKRKKKKIRPALTMEGNTSKPLLPRKKGGKK